MNKCLIWAATLNEKKSVTENGKMKKMKMMENNDKIVVPNIVDSSPPNCHLNRALLQKLPPMTLNDSSLIIDKKISTDQMYFF